MVQNGSPLLRQPDRYQQLPKLRWEFTKLGYQNDLIEEQIEKAKKKPRPKLLEYGHQEHMRDPYKDQTRSQDYFLIARLQGRPIPAGWIGNALPVAKWETWIFRDTTRESSWVE
ncbi:unnamed protein product [Clavelina lepadiformis]|uniref:Uncharacterized protein n=1 Tax=Clavelina lepadiformis TaxID=159417 RepID=A0ABP0FBE8_CLALP